jgi:hypothetical protein
MSVYLIGKICWFLVNGCVSSPCQNNGECVSNCSLGTCSINCICLNSTSGVYCEEKDNSCLTISCLNGGTCLMNKESNIPYCQCPLNAIGSR